MSSTRIIFFSLFLVSVFTLPSDYNGKCATCVGNSFFYCLKTDNCQDTLQLEYSCGTGITHCLNYKASDYGVLQIKPFNQTNSNLTISLRNGDSAKFAISNQDSKSKAWFEV